MPSQDSRNQEKPKPFKKAEHHHTNWPLIGVVVAVALLVVLGTFFLWQTQQSAVFQEGDEVTVRGEVTNRDFTPVFTDGNGLITVKTKEYGELTIGIPARRWQMCEASGVGRDNDITDEITVGDTIEVRGAVTHEEVIPCESAEHYIKIIEPTDDSDPIPSEVENWQTYRNEEYGFEVGYPADGLVKEYPPTAVESNFSICIQRNKDRGMACSRPRVLIDVKPKSEKESELKYANAVYQNKNQIMIDSINAVKFTTPKELAPVNYVIAEHKGAIFIISSTPPSSEESKFDQILATFRFVDFATEVPDGYYAGKINVKFKQGTDLDPPKEALPLELQSSVKDMQALFTLSKAELDRIDASGDVKQWFRITITEEADPVWFINELKSMDSVETAEFAPKPAPPPM